MSEIAIGIILSLFAGLAITLGAFLASVKLCHSYWGREELKHAIIAFGGGALISAIAFVLIPEGTEHQSHISSLITFGLGGVCFMFIDIFLAKSGSKLAQFFAMMLDFVPEAIILGVVVISGNINQAIFIAVVIAAQNLPEGYAAYVEMAESKKAKNNLLMKFLIVGLTGPIYFFLGAHVFSQSPMALSMILTFCAGGVLYLVFEDISPKVAMEKHFLPPLGAVAGFMVGLAGYLMVG
ncbi:MAG: ZIP family zinc transporter [Rickettsiales bacterium]|jgi:ZIP family zinc transporter